MGWTCLITCYFYFIIHLLLEFEPRASYRLRKFSTTELNPSLISPTSTPFSMHMGWWEDEAILIREYYFLCEVGGPVC
jgi:hypothetical protein